MHTLHSLPFSPCPSRIARPFVQLPLQTPLPHPFTHSPPTCLHPGHPLLLPALLRCSPPLSPSLLSLHPSLPPYPPSTALPISFFCFHFIPSHPNPPSHPSHPCLSHPPILPPVPLSADSIPHPHAIPPSHSMQRISTTPQVVRIYVAQLPPAVMRLPRTPRSLRQQRRRQC